MDGAIVYDQGVPLRDRCINVRVVDEIGKLKEGHRRSYSFFVQNNGAADDVRTTVETMSRQTMPDDHAGGSAAAFSLRLFQPR